MYFAANITKEPEFTYPTGHLALWGHGYTSLLLKRQGLSKWEGTFQGQA